LSKKVPYEKIQIFLENNLPSYLDMLRQMVAINSFTANSNGVTALADLTANLFSPLGFRAEYIPSINPDYGVHLILSKTGNSEKNIALVSHLDTVFPPEEETENDFHWREEGDRIYGPGTVDIKGGTMMIFMILDALRTFFPKEFADMSWHIALNASEETMSADFEDVCLSHLNNGKVLGCLVFEGGPIQKNNFGVITNRKGMAVFRVTAEGKGAHAGSAHPDGANAILQMAHVVQKISAMTDYEKQITYNVGTIQGGTVTNRVPHFAEIRVEMRAFDNEVFEEGISKMMSLNEQSDVTSQNGYPCKVIVELSYVTNPWEPNPGSKQLLKIWQNAAADLGAKVKRTTRGGLSDGNLLWKHFPTLDALGPSGSNAHSSERSEDGSKDQEYVEVSSIVPKTLLNIIAIRKLIEESLIQTAD
jgi:glutamate carboxypeptidase